MWVDVHEVIDPGRSRASHLLTSWGARLLTWRYVRPHKQVEVYDGFRWQAGDLEGWYRDQEGAQWGYCWWKSIDGHSHVGLVEAELVRPRPR